VPAVNVTPNVVVNALPNDHAPPTPLNVMAAAKDVPPVVMVLPVVVELNVIVPVDVHVVVDVKDILPETANVGVVPVANVQPVTEVVNDRQVNAPVIVTVLGVPEEALKNTLSEAVGTAAPPAPPEVKDQFVVVVVSQVPVPPTQYLSVIGCHIL